MSQPRGLTILNWSTKMIKPSQVDAPPGLSQVLRSCIEEAGVMLQLPWHLYHIAMAFYSMIGGHPDNPQDYDPCCSRPQGARPGKLNKVNAWVNLNLCLCHKVFFSSRIALSASLTLVAHIHTPPLHEKGGSEPSTQAPDNLRAATGLGGEWKWGGQPIMSVWVV